MHRRHTSKYIILLSLRVDFYERCGATGTAFRAGNLDQSQHIGRKDTSRAGTCIMFIQRMLLLCGTDPNSHLHPTGCSGGEEIPSSGPNSPASRPPLSEDAQIGAVALSNRHMKELVVQLRKDCKESYKQHAEELRLYAPMPKNAVSLLSATLINSRRGTVPQKADRLAVRSAAPYSRFSLHVTGSTLSSRFAQANQTGATVYQIRDPDAQTLECNGMHFVWNSLSEDQRKNQKPRQIKMTSFGVSLLNLQPWLLGQKPLKNAFLLRPFR